MKIMNVRVEVYPEEEPQGLRLTFSPELLQALASCRRGQLHFRHPLLGNVIIAVDPHMGVEEFPVEATSAIGARMIYGVLEAHPGSASVRLAQLQKKLFPEGEAS